MIEKIPNCIQGIIGDLEERGFEAYLVGGCVRDLLRGGEPKDWDICTAALPKRMMEIFPDCLKMGSKFGTIGVQTQEGIVEITTFREELGYCDKRHPDVRFVGDLGTDLARRDFTINAMAYHPQKGLVDLFGGKQDLLQGILRCVGECDVRFQEDALRILRLVRFSCTLGFSPDKETLRSAKRAKNLLECISKERVRDEILLALRGEFFADFFRVYEEIFAFVLPELKRAKKHKISNPSLIFAFLFEREEDVRALERLKFSKVVIERTRELLKYKNMEVRECKISLKMLLKEIGYDCLMALLELQKLGGKNTKKPYALIQEIMICNECFCLKDLQISGNELKTMGLSGKEIGDVLEILLNEVIQGELANTPQALKERALFLSHI